MVPDPEIIEIRREPGDVRIVGEEWHTDTTMMAEPPMGAILYAIEVPPYGGDTLFASQYLAYEALSDGMKRLLEGLRAVHSDRKVAGPQAGMNAYRATKVREEGWEETVSTHPVVRTHPETGRKLLFVNHSYTIRFDGMTEAESAPLLGYLLAARARPPARVHLPLPLGQRVGRVLGQPVRETPCRPRRRALPADHAPGPDRGRQAGLRPP